MTIKIETGIPIPIPIGNYGDHNVYEAIRNLSPGDSFFVAGRTVNVAGASWRTVKLRHKECADWKFTARTKTENGVKGVRVWRVS